MRIFLIIFALISAGCATLATTLPPVQTHEIETEQALQTREALKTYMADYRRLQDIALPILAANTEFCDKRGIDIGAYTLSEKDLPKALRGKNGSVDLKSPAIVYSRNPALPKGAVFVDERGKAISVSKINPDVASVNLRIGGDIVGRKITPAPICDYPVRLKYTPAINAYANGKNITVTTGMMKFTNDEELALIIGHELAHNTHSHIRKIVQNTILGFGRGTFARQFESEADYVGLYYSARAGYPIENTKRFWRNLAKVSVKSIDKAKTHPITPERYVRLESAVLEIKAKQAAGLPLEPKLK